MTRIFPSSAAEAGPFQEAELRSHLICRTWTVDISIEAKPMPELGVWAKQLPCDGMRAEQTKARGASRTQEVQSLGIQSGGD